MNNAEKMQCTEEKNQFFTCMLRFRHFPVRAQGTTGWKLALNMDVNSGRFDDANSGTWHVGIKL